MDCSEVAKFLDGHSDFLERYVVSKVSSRQMRTWMEVKAHLENTQTNVNVINGESSTSNGHDEVDGVEDDDDDRESLHSDDEDRQVELLPSSTSTRHSFIHVRPSECRVKRPRSRSLFSTPLRKLSAARFEASGLKTPILTTNLQGQPTFLRSDMGYVKAGRRARIPNASSMSAQKTARVAGRKSAIVSRRRVHDNDDDRDDDNEDETMKLLRLVQKVMEERDLASSVVALLDGLQQVLRSDHTALLWNADESCHPSLNGTLFRVTGTGVLTQSRGGGSDGPEASLLASTVALEHSVRVHYNTVESEECEAFNAALTAPLIHNHMLHGALVVARSTSSKNVNRFSREQEAKLDAVAKMVTAMLVNCGKMEEMRLELARSEVFLELAHTVFSEQSRLEPAIRNILYNFLMMIDCDRAQILLLASNPDSPAPSFRRSSFPLTFSRVFDLQRDDLHSVCETELESNGHHECSIVSEGREAVLTSIAAHVARVGEVVNIADLSSDQRFQMDRSHNHKSLLCMPIRDASGLGTVLGVISLLDKDESAEGFSSNDERFVEAFALFCGMAIKNAGDLERSVVSEAKLQVAFEVMSYQASASPSAAKKLANGTFPTCKSLQLDAFNFDYRQMAFNDTFKACVRMFIDLGLFAHFRIDTFTFCRWLMSVKKNYRNDTVPYHNWWHAFNVAQVMFSVLKNTRWHIHFGPVDCLGMMIACLCHDLDHRGTTNTFQAKSNNPLAKLYSSSTLERHHLNQCLLLLSVNGNRILENLEHDEFSATVSVIERCILATDLAVHFRNQAAIHALASCSSSTSSGCSSLFTSSTSLSLVQNALMTAADLGASTKPWPVHYHVSQLIAEEFWTQGDLERDTFDTEQLAPMLDRSVSLSQVQVDFLDNVCIPVYSDLASFSNVLTPMLEQCRSNCSDWRRGRHQETNDQRDEQRANTQL